MHIVVINSQKGGSGKTMLAKHLSVEAERAGDGPMYLIDTDPQGSLTAWHAKREADAPTRVEFPFARRNPLCASKSPLTDWKRA